MGFVFVLLTAGVSFYSSHIYYDLPFKRYTERNQQNCYIHSINICPGNSNPRHDTCLS